MGEGFVLCEGEGEGEDVPWAADRMVGGVAGVESSEATFAHREASSGGGVGLRRADSSGRGPNLERPGARRRGRRRGVGGVGLGAIYTFEGWMTRCMKKMMGSKINERTRSHRDGPIGRPRGP